MKLRVLAVLLIVVALASLLAACSAQSTEEKNPDEAGESVKPSNGGGTGQAVNLKGDPTAGQQIFATTCTPCHGQQGKGGVQNPGSKDGTVPPLNPIDSTMPSKDYKTFASNIDLFLEHGSTPEGGSPSFKMPSFGDSKMLTPQQIADVISYVISLNPTK